VHDEAVAEDPENALCQTVSTFETMHRLFRPAASHHLALFSFSLNFASFFLRISLRILKTIVT